MSKVRRILVELLQYFFIMQGGRKYEETPPLDVSTKPIYPSMLYCNIPAKDLILQLAASITSTKVLHMNFILCCNILHCYH